MTNSYPLVSLCLLMILFGIVYSNIETECGANEEYNECGSACQENCTHVPEFCTLQCVPGCFCKLGFVRQTDHKSKCVLRSQCPCPANEFYNECNSACPDTCAARSQRCTRQCIPSCSCKNGFIRLNNQSHSPCIPESQCHNSLCYDSNAEYTECGSSCPQSCDDERNSVRKFRLCSTKCQRGCFCKKGFVLENNGRCVQPETCCRTMKGLYRKCESACPHTCINPNNSTCSLPCVSGCFCLEEHVRKNSNLNSPCIPKSLC